MNTFKIQLKRKPSTAAPHRTSFFPQINQIKEKEDIHESANNIDCEDNPFINDPIPKFISSLPNPFKNNNSQIHQTNKFYTENNPFILFRQNKENTNIPSTISSVNNIIQPKNIFSNSLQNIAPNTNAKSLNSQIISENIPNIYINNFPMRQRNSFAHNNNSNNNLDKKGINPFKQEDKKFDLSNINNYVSENCPFCDRFIKLSLKKHILSEHIDKLELKDLIDYSYKLVSLIKDYGRELDKVITIIYPKMKGENPDETFLKWCDEMQNFYTLKMKDL